MQEGLLGNVLDLSEQADGLVRFASLTPVLFCPRHPVPAEWRPSGIGQGFCEWSQRQRHSAPRTAPLAVPAVQLFNAQRARSSGGGSSGTAPHHHPPPALRFPDTLYSLLLSHKWVNKSIGEPPGLAGVRPGQTRHIEGEGAGARGESPLHFNETLSLMWSGRP